MKILKRINRYFTSNSFIKSISTLATGSVIAQLITMLTSPITTRLFSPEEFGMYTLLMTAINIFNPILCARYDLVIVTEKDEKNVFALIKSSFLITFILSSVISLGYFIYFMANQKYHPYLYSVIILFIILLSSGLTNVITSYNNRCQEYSLMTQVYVIRTFAQNGLMIILGFLKTGVFGLLVTQTVSQLLGLKKQGKTLINNIREIISIDKKEMQNICRKYKKQPLFSTPAAFANSFSYSSINIFIESLFGSIILGYYSLSYRVLGLPLNIISNNVSKVFFENASKEYNETGSYLTSLKKTTLFLLCISVPMLVFLLMFSPTLFSFVFGKNWRIAGVYVQILAPMFAVRFIVIAVSVGLVIAQKQGYELIIQILFIAISISLFIIIKLLELDVYTYLSFISISFTCIYVFYYIIVYKSSKKHE